MKAVLYQRYGSPDVLEFTEVEKPTPNADQVLIKIHTAAANPLDWHYMRGAPFFFRFVEMGFPKPKNPKLGADLAGVVEAVGNSVTEFQVGDAVFGDASMIGLGAFAEYICLPANAVALKPARLSFEEAAALPVAALTALQGLRDAGGLQAGHKVLVNGASGGVGSFAVQIAKAMGATVTGVCSTRNLDLVRSIGADAVIDYTRDDFAKTGQQYDLIFDAVGNRSVPDFSRALAPQGRCVVAGFTTLPHLFHILLRGAWAKRTTGKQIGQMGTVKPNQSDLLLLASLADAGKLKPVIDRCYPLAETAEAIRYLETMRARGKVVIGIV